MLPKTLKAYCDLTPPSISTLAFWFPHPPSVPAYCWQVHWVSLCMYCFFSMECPFSHLVVSVQAYLSN